MHIPSKRTIIKKKYLLNKFITYSPKQIHTKIKDKTAAAKI